MVSRVVPLALWCVVVVPGFAQPRLDLPQRWVYCSRNLWVDKNVDDIEALLRRAAKAGYTGVLLAVAAGACAAARHPNPARQCQLNARRHTRFGTRSHPPRDGRTPARAVAMRSMARPGGNMVSVPDTAQCPRQRYPLRRLAEFVCPACATTSAPRTRTQPDASRQ